MANRLAVAAFVVAAVFVPGILGMAWSPRWWAVAVLVPLLTNVDPRDLWRPVRLCLLAGFAWAAFSIAWSPEPQHALLDLYFVALLTLTMAAAAGTDDLEPVLAAFGWGVAVSSALAVGQALGWHPLPGPAAPAGTFLNPEVLAELAAPMAAWAAFKGRGALAAAMVVPVILCGSRIAPAAALIGLAAGWRGAPAFRFAAVGAIFGGALLAVAFAAPDKLASGASRIILWISATHSVAPLGRGLGWWVAAHPGPIERFAHSDLLQAVVELGAGAALFLAVPILLIKRWAAAEPGERAACAAIAFESIVSFPLHLPASGFLACVLAGGLARARPAVRLAEHAGGADAGDGVRRPAPLGGAMGPGGHDRLPGDAARPGRGGGGALGSPARGGALTWTSTR